MSDHETDGRSQRRCQDRSLRLTEPPRQVLRTVGARAARELDALRGFDDECVGFVATRLRRAVLAPGEVVYAPGRAADEMYFVAHGAVRLIPAAAAASGGIAGGQDADGAGGGGGEGLGTAGGSSRSLGGGPGGFGAAGGSSWSLGGDTLAAVTVADAAAAAGEAVEVRRGSQWRGSHGRKGRESRGQAVGRAGSTDMQGTQA
jgi:hypothetical protein